MTKRLLIIQTAFIGDVILATALIETIAKAFPEAKIDFVLRKGNASLLDNNPHVNQVFIWDKKNKLKGLKKLLFEIRKHSYDELICLQRFLSGNLISLFAKSKNKRVFENSPLSFLFSHTTKHVWGDGTHEIERNHKLLKGLIDGSPENPKLYPSVSDFNHIERYQTSTYNCVAPNSVWFTKTLPLNKWDELIHRLEGTVYIIGAPNDFELGERLKKSHPNVVNLCGKLSFLQSAALMQKAKMNYVNDSAPLHLCSAMNAPVTAFFCSTTADFGFGPLSSQAFVMERKDLDCKPCGKHGHKSCPKGHFKCSQINIAVNHGSRN